LINEVFRTGGQVSYVHHSSPLAGQPVAGARRLTVVAGKITKIDNESGHYTSRGEYLWQTIEWLKASGMPIDAIDVTLVEAGTEPEKILKGWKFEQTGGNQTQVRLKDDLMSVVEAPQKMAQEIQKEKEETARRRAEEAEKQRKVAALVKGSPAEIHYKRRGCLDWTKSQYGDYCERCAEDL
jgi:hypothetical protein